MTRTFRHCRKLINHTAHDIFYSFPVLQPAAHFYDQLIIRKLVFSELSLQFFYSDESLVQRVEVLGELVLWVGDQNLPIATGM